MELKKEHWLQAEQDNQNMILQSMIMIEMSEAALVKIREKLAEFPEEPKTPEKPKV